MDISFEHREISVYREYAFLQKRVQESAECVVPDTDMDIEKIVATQSSVSLKSKDLSAHGLTVSGEFTASVLYIRDEQDGISFLSVRKPFSLEFDVEAPETETLAQVSLTVQGTDVRVLNPRKISVSFEVEGDLSCYRSEKLCVESRLPENVQGLHAHMEKQLLTMPTAVCEKSVPINEQFLFSGENLPERLIAEKNEIIISDCQVIGRKIIVKGVVKLLVYTSPKDGEVPYATPFSTAFSQIVDIGAENIEFCTVRAEITSAYFDLIDTINGEKALDMELHAVLQLVCSEQCEISSITDAYSNLMPSELLCRTEEFRQLSAVQTQKMNIEEKLGLMEDCAELLQVFPAISRISADTGKLSAAVSLDFLYKNNDGQLSSGRRTLTLSQAADGEELRILRLRLLQQSVEAEGESANCVITLEATYLTGEKTELSAVDGILLHEEGRYTQEALPTLTLVRANGESLWSLAKKYHSSEEAIHAMNENADTTEKMLLIPKCV